MDVDLLKALLRPRKRSHYLGRVWRRQGALDPALVTSGCISAGISTLGYRYLDKYPVLLDVNGRSITESVLRHGHFQFDLFEVLSQFYPRRDVQFINIGANIGTSCLNAFEAGFRDIVAFEPVGQNFSLLQHNVSGLGVKTRHQAVGTEPGRLEIHLSRGSTGKNSFMRDFGEGSEEVEVVRLDDVVDSKPGFLWIDTEGYEVHVLLGAENYLANHAEGLCVEITPSMLKDEGVAKLQTILIRHFKHFYTSSGQKIETLDLGSLVADGRQIDLFALK
jgi:FkbM family methyltransferase